MKQLRYTLMMGILIGFISCSENKREENKEEELIEEATEPLKKLETKAVYPIPSPEQMFDFINQMGVSYSNDLLNDANNKGTYENPIDKALNFGVYTADLAYAAAFEDIENTIELYRVAKDLSAELNIEEMMTEETLVQVQNNLQNNDSLVVIARNSYYDAVDYLERNDQGGKLALMSLGGWIESIYIAINSIDKFDAESELIQRIADQKITFGNLYSYLKKNQDAIGVKDALNDVQEIRSVFASLQEEKKAKAKKSSETGKMVLSSSTRIVMTEQQFEQLKKLINSYRQNITTI